MKKFFSFLIVILISASISHANHFTGGEITWTCQGSNYVFHVKFYRDCNGIPGPNPSLDLQTTVPGLSLINCVLISTADITPQGSSTSGNINCSFCDSATGSTPGTVEEYYYESAAITLPGIPPASGWTFYYESCCRSGMIINISNPISYSTLLRAKMYPHSGSLAGQCTDASPGFSEKPMVLQCNSYQVNFNNCSEDAEHDSLSYSWDYPQSSGGVNIPFAPGYSVNSQLPGTVQNPNNVAETLNSHSGQISYKSYTSGIFVTVIKVAAYKCGELVAEIFREINLTLLNGCKIPTSSGLVDNNAPQITPPFPGPAPWTTTVCAGDLVEFNLPFIDSDLHPVLGVQSVVIDAAGEEFGTGFSNANAGCPFLPCATLAPAPPYSVIYGSQITFHWQTSINHLVCKPDYYFYFRLKDNFCPSPALNYQTVKITVLPPNCNVGIDGHSAFNSGLNIFPNPVKDELIVTGYLLSGKKSGLKIYDLMGRIIYQTEILISNSAVKINISELKSGIYFLAITTNAGNWARKIVRQ